MPDPVAEQDAVIVHGVLVRLLRLEVLQSSGVKLLKNRKSRWVHLETSQLVHNLVEEDALLVAVSLHGQCEPALCICQAVANASQLC